LKREGENLHYDLYISFLKQFLVFQRYWSHKRKSKNQIRRRNSIW
jgi:hypothetical protein